MPDDSGGTRTDDVDDRPRDWHEADLDADVSPAELLEQFAAALDAAKEDGVSVLVQHDDLDAIEASVDALESDVSALQRDLDEKIRDVRERVIQVKREADAKAPADHTHDELAARLPEALEAANRANAGVEDLETTIDELDDRLDAGFENYETILEYLTDTVDDLERKNTHLAEAVVRMRDAVQGITEREGRRIAADRLREHASTQGIRTATCENCEASLDVALLTDARCPHCASTFASIEPKRGFFGSPTLTVGDRPALEAPEADDASFTDFAGDAEGIPPEVETIAEATEQSTDE
jgi:prefoldin subunit 5